uniref:hypothetical protein n=1 Tax=Saccharothrix mutabilis TaxID=33921 RepID=UPI0031D29692
MTGSNDLVVQPDAAPGGVFNAGTGDNGWATGVSIAESAMDTFNGIKDGNWIEAGLGMVGLAADAAAMAIDPFGTLMSSAASFLMEHVQPLKDMLDWLAGNPPVIESYAATWGKVSEEFGSIAEDYKAAVARGTAGWGGAAAAQYLTNASAHGDALAGAASAAGTVGTVVGMMGMVVGFVREMVRDLIADLVGKLIAWVLEAVFSLGFGTPVIVAQAVTAISKWAAKIAKIIQDLLNTIKKVSPMLKRLVEVFEKVMKVLGKIAGKATGLDVLDPKNIKKGGFLQTGKADVDTPNGSTGTGSGDGDGSSPGDGDSTGDGNSPGNGDPDTPTPSNRPGEGTTNTASTPTPTDTPRPGRTDPGDTTPTGTPRPGRDPGGNSPDSDQPRGLGEHRGGPGGNSPVGETRGGPGGNSPSSDYRPAPGGTPVGEHRGGPGGQPSPGYNSTPGGGPGSGPGGGGTPSGQAGAPGGGGTPGGYNGAPGGGGGTPGGYSSGPGGGPGGGGSPGGGGGGSYSGGGPNAGNPPNAPTPTRYDHTSAAAATPDAPARPDQPHTPTSPGPHNPTGPTGGAPTGTPGGGMPGTTPGGGPSSPGSGAPGGAGPRPGGTGGWTGTPGTRGDLGSGIPHARTPEPPRTPTSPHHTPPSHTTPSHAGPPHAGPAHAGPPHSGPTPSHAGPGHPGTPHTGPSHANPPHTGPSHSGPPHAGPSHAGPPHNGPANNGPGRPNAGPPHANPPHAGPPHAGPARPGPGPNPPHHGPTAPGAPHNRPGPIHNGPPHAGPHTPGRPDAPHAPGRPDAPHTPTRPDAPHTSNAPGRPDAPHTLSRPDTQSRPDAPHDPKPWTPPHRDPDTSHPDSTNPDKTDNPNTPDTTPDTTPDRTPDIDEAHARHGETTPSGISHHRGDPDMGDLPHRVPHDPRYFTADVHITPDGRARIGNHTYTPEQYGDLLRRNGWDGKTPIRLIGCDAGTNDFARRLSHHTGADVLAPTKPAWTDSKGRVYTSDAEIGPDGNRQPKIPPNGEWETHRPDGTKTKTSQDGYVPGTPDHHRTNHTDADDARDRMAKPVKAVTDSPDYDRTPQHQTTWDPPRQPNGDPLPEVALEVPPGTRVSDFNGGDPLQPNSRMVVTDSDGNPRGVFYTDADRNITHVETSLPNKGFGTDPYVAPTNPDLDKPVPGAVYRLDLGHNFNHVYEAPVPHTRGPSGPEPDATAPPPRDPAEPAPVHPPQRFDGFDSGNAPAAVDWDPPGNADGHYTTADPVRDYDVRTDGPFSLKGPLDRHTRYDVYDKNGDWHGTFYTDGDGNFSHVHTWSGNQEHGFNPELGTGRTWSDQRDVPRPNTIYAVGPKHMENHGMDPREPRQLYRTDEHGDTIAASGKPDYPPAGTSAAAHWGPRRGEGGIDNDGKLQTDVGQIATGGQGPGSTHLPGELDQKSKPLNEQKWYRFAGGHLVSYEAGGPGERINHVPQWAYENSNWKLSERPTSDSWRAMENDLTKMGQQRGVNVDRFDVWAERQTPDRHTPDALHARWTLSTDNPPLVRTEGRSFHNVPEQARHPNFRTPPPAGTP